MKTQAGCTALQTFDPSWGEAWTKYIEWSRLDHLKEVVSLDCSLCPTPFDDLVAQDRDPQAYKDIFIDLFDALDYLLTRIKTKSRYQGIGAIRGPGKIDISTFPQDRI